MDRICVYCGSSPGRRPEYAAAAREVGIELNRRGIGLVYGGGSVGLMGELARTVIKGGGNVIGVLPDHLVHEEIAFLDLADLRVVGSMHERKALMAELADGFIALPGGLGTLEELFEALTWAQLGLHAKPCGVLDVCGYYSGMIEFINHAVAEQFVQRSNVDALLVERDAARLLASMGDYTPRPVDKIAWAVRTNAFGALEG